jgi:hypothetical protein
MGFLIARISGFAIGVVFALVAFILQLLIRKKNLPVRAVRIISAIGALGGIYLFVSTLGNVLKYDIGLSSIITVFSPLLVYALVLTLHFIIIFTSAGHPKAWRVFSSTLTVSMVVSIQLGFALFNLIRNWNNLSRGMLEFLYLQLVGLILILITAVLFWIGFAGTRKFIVPSTVPASA